MDDTGGSTDDYNAIMKARDLWAHKNVKFTNGGYSANVPSHGVLLLRVSAK